MTSAYACTRQPGCASCASAPTLCAMSTPRSHTRTDLQMVGEDVASRLLRLEASFNSLLSCEPPSPGLADAHAIVLQLVTLVRELQSELSALHSLPPPPPIGVETLAEQRAQLEDARAKIEVHRAQIGA
eukprot:4640825-Pleurochrysis_carterae.AAC.1